MEDYKALIEEARVIPLPFEEPEELLLLRDLADAVEALVAEKGASVTTEYHDGIVNYAQRVILRLVAERDAIRAQLDAMTTEWKTVSNDDPPIETVNWQPEQIDHLHGFAEAHGDRIMKRLVGPWVEVTD